MAKLAICRWLSRLPDTMKDEATLDFRLTIDDCRFSRGFAVSRKVRYCWSTWVKSSIFAVALACLYIPLLRADQPKLAEAKSLTVLEGRLVTTRGDCPVLSTHGREQPLAATTPYLLHTMQDKRLDGRPVHLEGTPQPDGTFKVEWLYTVHGGKLFRVRYFCATCNIVALEPGNCVCCQQPTELQEIPKE